MQHRISNEENPVAVYAERRLKWALVWAVRMLWAATAFWVAGKQASLALSWMPVFLRLLQWHDWLAILIGLDAGFRMAGFLLGTLWHRRGSQP